MGFVDKVRELFKNKVFVGVLAGIVIVVASIFIVAGPKEGTQETEDLGVSGTFVLGDFPRFGNLESGDSCAGDGGYSDIHNSTQVVARDGQGSILSITRLGAGVADGIGNCVFSFSFSEVPMVDFFGFEVANRGEVRYSYDDLTSEDFRVYLSLGDVEVDTGTNVAETSNDSEEPKASFLPPRDEALEAIRVNAEKEWSDNYRMIQYEISNQTEAYDWLTVNGTEHPRILQRAINDWGDNYRMVKYEYERQVEAFEELQE